MKYMVHLPLVHFARQISGKSHGDVLPETVRPQEGDLVIYSIFQMEFSDQCVPRIGESFPVAPPSPNPDHFNYVKRVVDVTRFPVANKPWNVRQPVVVLEPVYEGIELHPSISPAEWKKLTVEEVTRANGIAADIRVLLDGGYKLWYGPTEEPYDPRVFLLTHLRPNR